MTQQPMTPASFVAKWKRAKLSERTASQEHFIDLCHLLGHPLAKERTEVDQKILTNLLRLNHLRAAAGDK